MKTLFSGNDSIEGITVALCLSLETHRLTNIGIDSGNDFGVNRHQEEFG